MAIFPGYESNHLKGGDYHSWRRFKDAGGNWNDFDQNSRNIIEFKKGNILALNMFSARVNDIACGNITICVVPSHEAGKLGSPLCALARQLVQYDNTRVDGSDCLVRHTTIQKLAAGGPRHKRVHLDSILLQNPHLITGRRVLLIDDVSTTGGSLSACVEILNTANPVEVGTYVFGETVFEG